MTDEKGAWERARQSIRLTDFVEKHLAIDSEPLPHTGRIGTFKPVAEGGLPFNSVYIELYDSDEGRYHRIVSGRTAPDGFIEPMFVLSWENGGLTDGSGGGQFEGVSDVAENASRLFDLLERLDREGQITWGEIEPLSY